MLELDLLAGKDSLYERLCASKPLRLIKTSSHMLKEKEQSSYINKGVITKA